MAFVRLQGCNLLPPCSWCDTRYAVGEGGSEVSVDGIVERVSNLHGGYQRRWVCITGGEPLMQEGLKDLAMGLKDEGYLLEVETNGSFPPPKWYALVDCWVSDVKCPSSGVCGVSLWREWFGMRRVDCVKFVVGSEEDLEFVSRLLEERACIPQVLVSPVCGADGSWNQAWLRRVWQFCIDRKLRFSLQVHKVVWGLKKGV